MSKTCATCDAFTMTDDRRQQGYCRANPPIPILMGYETGLHGIKEPLVRAFFPPMLSHGWCRAHQDRIELSKIDLTQLGNIQAEGSA